MNLTKTPYLVLFILLGAAGVGTASALMTITLAGDVKITGDTELEGKLLDTNDEAGTSGQVLTSTETGIDWKDVDKSFSQVKTFRVASSDPSFDKIQCSSNKNFVVHVYLKLVPLASYSLTLRPDLNFAGVVTTLSATEGFLHSYTVGGITSGFVIVDTTSSITSIQGQLVLQTTSDAIASCADVP